MNRWWLVLLILSAPLFGQSFVVKGIHIGMTKDEAKMILPFLECGKRTTEAGPDVSFECHSDRGVFTLLHDPLAKVLVDFGGGDRLILVSFYFRNHTAVEDNCEISKTLIAELSKKYGEPAKGRVPSLTAPNASYLWASSRGAFTERLQMTSDIEGCRNTRLILSVVAESGNDL